MPDDTSHDLHRVGFFKNKDGSSQTDRAGLPLLDAIGMPARRIYSPTWTMVGRDGAKTDGEIPPQYCMPAISLANCSFFKPSVSKERKKKPAWDADHDGAKFFMIRDQWIKACEAARTHDWDKDIEQFEFRRSLDEKAAELGASTRKYRRAIAKDRYGGAQKLAFFLAAAFERRTLNEDEASKMTSSVPPAVLLGALDDFAEHCEQKVGRGTGFFLYGPVCFLRLPKRLPAREVALALQLADLFSCWRTDTQKVLPMQGRVPCLTTGTPWKALTRFVDAAFCSEVATPNLQKRAEVMASSVMIEGLPHR